MECPRPLAVGGAVWVSYLVPAGAGRGLVPSGQQASADRYTYLPGIVLAMAVAGAGARWAAGHAVRGRVAVVAAIMVVAASAVITRSTLAPWTDSISLWTRVVALDPANDVGLYNLGASLAAAGRPEDAAARYRRPGHPSSRRRDT
jgi:hypothetical protein